MRRHLVLFLIVAGLALTAGLVALTWLIAETPDQASPLPLSPDEIQTPAPDPLPTGGLLVTEVSGMVGRLPRSGQNMAPIVAGEHISPDESIATGDQASAKLRVDDHSEIQLSAQSELKFREMNDKIHRFTLVRGRIGVNYGAGGGRRLRVESEMSDAVVESEAGSFSLLNNDGTVSLATVSGEAQIQSRGETAVVRAGSISRVLPGEPPAQPAPIPLTVMLRVARPAVRVQRETFTFVSGVTDIGARIHVNEITAPVDSRGKFKVRVPLEIGPNRIVVKTEDVAGNVKTEELPSIIVDVNAPIDGFKIHWGKQHKSG